MIDAAIKVTEFVDTPVKLTDPRRRPSSMSRAAETAANHTYHNIALVGAADSEHDMSKFGDEVRSEADATVRLESSAIVGSEVTSASTNVISEATDTIVGHDVGSEATNAIVGSEATNAIVRHGESITNCKSKSNIMRSGRGGSRWRSKIGKSAGAIESQRDVNGNTRQTDSSVGRDEGRGEMHDRSR